MKNKFTIYVVSISAILLFLIVCCKIQIEKTIPIVAISAVKNITSTTASCGGSITNAGGTAITERGVCWSFSQNPTIEDSKITSGTGIGSFECPLTGLTPGATYFLKAYAINSSGTGYSNEVSFATIALLPVLTTLVLSDVTVNSVSSGGNITSDGGSLITARGVCWSNTQVPTIAKSKTIDGTGKGSFSSLLTGLVAGTTYYVRAYATNSIGTAYGNQETTTTLSVLPVITTSAASAITSTTASISGNVVNDGGSAVTALGVCWSLVQYPTTADPKTSENTTFSTFTSYLTGLLPGKTYYIRSYAINIAGTSYGNQIAFTTTAILPFVTTTAPSEITSTTASSGGNISYDGGSAVTARGVCWNTTQFPTISNSKTNDSISTGNFNSLITGLTASTTYYIRAYATNNIGTSYGNQVSLTTKTSMPVVTTNVATAVTSTTATTGGSFSGSSVTAFGVCWSLQQYPTTSNTKTTESTSSNTFTSYLTGLLPGTTYYIRAYTINTAGTSYGNQIAINTIAILPVVTTIAASGLTSTTASSGGSITYDGGSAVIARGVCWNTTQNPTITNPKTIDGNSSGNFNSSITGLLPSTTYYIRAYATNSIGTSYGNQVTATTTAVLPVITTTTPTAITSTSVTSGGNLSGSPVTALGVCWSLLQYPTTNDLKTSEATNSGPFTSYLTGLLPGKTYYIRAYFTNNIGTFYGNQVAITTTAILPVITTIAPSGLTSTSASSGGNISYDGGSPITARGVCWSTTQIPTILNTKTIDSNGIGSFNSSITGLAPSTTYYVRAYATNSIGTSYGNQVTISTTAILPVITTTAATAITSTTATSGGNIGSSIATALGVCWSLDQYPTTKDSKTTESISTGAFTSYLVGLLPGKTYYIRAYAINSIGTSYGNQVAATTLGILPTITTNISSSITSTTISSGGNVSNNGGSSIIAQGVCWSTTQPPTISNSKTIDGITTGSFNSSITGLSPGTTYYIRAYATNSVGTGYGNQITTTTLAVLPVITTTTSTASTSSTATIGGSVSSDGGSTVTERGICWSIIQFPTITNNKAINGVGVGSYTCFISGLLPGTIYFIRAFATNSIGTSYGNQIVVTTSAVLPVITTLALSNITSTSAISGGDISFDGGTAITASGVCWSTSQVPTTSNFKTIDGTNIGSFVSSITGLSPGTNYYVRAYATNSSGTSYGSQLTLTTTAILPVISTSSTTAITSSTATSGGTIITNGGSTITALGICWSIEQYPTTTNTKTIDVTSISTYTSYLTGLLPGTTYYIRAYATNSVGTTYGNQVKITTIAILPSLTTTQANTITSTTAISGGVITSDGGSSVTIRGVCWSTSQNPTTTDTHTSGSGGIGSYISNLVGLTPNTTYYLRAYATNGIGTTYGNEVSFKTTL